MAKQRELSGLTQDKKDFIKLLDEVGYQFNTRDKFYNFCEISAFTLRMPFGGITQDELNNYKRVYGRYTKDQILCFGKMLGILINSLEAGYHDFLGKVFMNLDMGNEYAGQFFTPDCVCRMMAEINLHDIEPLLEHKDFITVNEPCCGAGAMIIAIADCLKAKGINYSNRVYVIAQDIDYLSCCMSFIQFSLCGVAATVINCDSLWPQEKTWHSWQTPVHHLNGWDFKLSIRRNLDALKSLPKPEERPQIVPEIVLKKYEKNEQMSFNFEAVA